MERHAFVIRSRTEHPIPEWTVITVLIVAGISEMELIILVEKKTNPETKNQSQTLLCPSLPKVLTQNQQHVWKSLKVYTLLHRGW